VDQGVDERGAQDALDLQEALVDQIFELALLLMPEFVVRLVELLVIINAQ